MIAASERSGDRLISVAEAQRRLGVGRTKTIELVLRGAIDSAKIDGRRLVSSSSVDRFIEAAIAANARTIEQ